MADFEDVNGSNNSNNETLQEVLTPDFRAEAFSEAVWRQRPA